MSMLLQVVARSFAASGLIFCCVPKCLTMIAARAYMCMHECVCVCVFTDANIGCSPPSYARVSPRGVTPAHPVLVCHQATAAAACAFRAHSVIILWKTSSSPAASRPHLRQESVWTRPRAREGGSRRCGGESVTGFLLRIPGVSIEITCGSNLRMSMDLLSTTVWLDHSDLIIIIVIIIVVITLSRSLSETLPVLHASLKISM